ncbi:UDPglucose 6-dehydrogenase [Desulforamulus putei DSM 12395]|uniref:UDP-glucose 6-dehydrogenase n=1 Tax=Desulforamulus putei DSM 12395 TaxID=1121429 RepID=A0A1M4VIE2_9FIRM|nr:UDP-glucose/GDP-mannose dehydrogenase family protein [Desulforamulus putei]SHE68791.1 UDPglucose 6-dehydrogenase [Desulforamulus putei DSM 12395]
MKVIVVGAGYVGLVAAACLSQSGHQVVCVDKNIKKIEALNNGIIPIYEENLESIVRESLGNNNLQFSSKIFVSSDIDMIIIAVGTPTLPDGRVDLSQVYNVFREIVNVVDHPIIVVMKSTVPPGVGEKVKKVFLNKSKVPISYISNPEFLREGQAVWDWYNPDRIVIGGDDRESIKKVLKLYSDIDAPRCIMDITSAEMVKYASNAFLATKISFINEIANLCELVGADILPVAKAVGLDKRIGGQFLKAGLGYGGSCFPKDTRGLDFVSTINGHTFNLLKSVIEVNFKQRIYAVRKLINHLGTINGKKVGVLGIAFKPNTDDTRESPAIDIIKMLVDEGADVVAYDPVVGSEQCPLPEEITLTNNYEVATKHAHALVICTEWPEILNIDWEEVAGHMRDPKVILDGRNCLSKSLLVELGFKYLGIGR